MRYFFFLSIITLATLSQAQIEMPSYTIRQDSATHITIFHIDNTELLTIKIDTDTSISPPIKPEIKMKSGIVDHKNLMGDIYARLYYSDSLLIAYITFDGSKMKRELYFNTDGNIFLEKRYLTGELIYTNNKLQFIHSKIKHDGSSK